MPAVILCIVRRAHLTVEGGHLIAAGIVQYLLREYSRLYKS